MQLAALAALVLVVYARAIGYGFIAFDDPSYVTDNEVVRQGITRSGLWWALTTSDRFYWHPLTWVSHMVVCQFAGLNPAAHHAVNVTIHAATVVLVFAVFRSMTGRPWPSAMVAALVAVHPLNVESVQWIAERKELLAAFFWFATIASYARYARRHTIGNYAMTIAAFALALMSKPVVVTLPIVLLALDIWPLRRTSTVSVRRLLIEKAPLAAMSACSMLLTYVGQVRAGATALLAHTTLAERVTHALAAYAIYVGQVCWPHDLAILYPYRSMVGLPIVAIGAALLVAGTVLAVATNRRTPHVAAGWIWFVVGLAPTIGLVPVGAQAHADRFMYLPAVGLFLAAVWLVADFVPPRIAIAAAGIALTLLTAAAIGQSRYWVDSVTLMRRTVEVTGDNPVARHLLAVSLAEEGRLDEAVENYRESLRLAPRNPLALENLGIALATLHRPQEAAAVFAEAVRQRPDYGEAHYGLGATLLDLNRRADARAELLASQRLPLPADYAAQASFRLGLIAAYDGDLARARDEFAAALRLQPDFAEARANLREAEARLARQGVRH
jgi:tetratricopeptide (TPR) repeat protein